MNKTLSFIRLDFLTVKPYLTLRNLLIFIAVAVIMIVTSYAATTAIGILMAFAALYASYPFAVGEKSNMDVLYVTLSIKRNMVVFGRYLFALVLDLCSGIIAFIFAFILLNIFRYEFNFIESLATVLLMFLFFSIVQAVQLPIYFKLGYTKAKFLAYLPFIGFPLLILLFYNSFGGFFSPEKIAGILEWLAANVLAAVLIGAFVWFAIMAVSFRISVSVYGKRDF